MRYKQFIILQGLLLIALTTIAQKPNSTRTRINDNGTTLEIDVERKSSDRNFSYKKEYHVKGMNQLQKDALVKQVLDSLEVNNHSEEHLTKPAQADINSTITKLNRELEAAFNANDMVKVAAFYTDDAEISGNNYLVKGRSKLDKYWMNLKDKGRGWKLDVVEIGGQGEFVYQLGKSDLDYLSGADDKPIKSVTNFVLIWRMQPGGSYKIFRDYLTDTKFSK